MEKESKFLRDANGYVAVRVSPTTEVLPAVEPDSMFCRDINGNVSVRVSGTAGEGSLFLVKEMEVPREAIIGAVRMYIGPTDSDFTHGYIYECVEDGSEHSGLIGFDPSKIAFDYTKGKLSSFFEEYNISNYWTIVSGSMTYDVAGDIWTINGVNAGGTKVFENLKLYTQDLEDSAFVFINPQQDYHDGEVIEYYINWTDATKCKWQQLNVQP